MAKILFANKNFGELVLPDRLSVREYFPGRVGNTAVADVDDLTRDALARPIACQPLKAMLKPSDRVLVLIDDNSRTTPVDVMLPSILEQIATAGVPDAQVNILVALGTHRPLDDRELRRRVGDRIYTRFRVLNHEWYNPDSLHNLGKTDVGTEIWVNKLAMKADFIIGLGHIVPHRVAGYSGGGKIIQPGISGPATTGHTHWLSAYYSAAEMLGQPDNPVRQEMEEVARRVGLRFIVNVVQDSNGKAVGVFAGDPVKAHREGCRLAAKVYGVAVAGQADIVISEAFPTESELWLATKALQAAAVVVKPGGVIILAAECAEGISPSHERIILEHGFQPLAEVATLVSSGVITDVNVASYLARVGNILQLARCFLVSRGVTPMQGAKMKFPVVESLNAAVEQALRLVNRQPEVAVLHHGSEILPILDKKNGG